MENIINEKKMNDFYFFDKLDDEIIRYKLPI